MRRIGAGIVAENSATWRFRRSFLQHRLDVVDETHAQHLVGFVEHQRGQSGQIERAALEVIDHAARGADHDV
jgi:hypothetical protein